MPTLNLLYQRQYKINDDIQVVIPTVGEILEDEDSYYGLVSLLTAMPIDVLTQLDDAGVDFSTINDYELFLMMFSGIKTQDTHLVFGDLDLTKFELASDSRNDTIVLWDSETDVVIDRSIHGQIASTLRKIHHLKKDIRKPGNEEARKYMIRRAREKQRRRQNRVTESQLESLIVAMVNTEQYKYDFERTRELSIYQFNESVCQIIKKTDFDNRMIGVYTGNIDTKHLSQDDLNWLTHK